VNSRNIRQTKAGKTIAKVLLDTKAVNFRPENPYKLTAGWHSPVYIDCRWLISFPWARRVITLLASEEIEENVGINNLDCIAGGETAGIPYASWISDTLDKPMIYVRKKPKGFGRMAQIEGQLEEDSRVILIEDLATDGGSKISFINAIREAGAICNETFVVFFYGVFQGSDKLLKDAGINLTYLCSWADVISVAEEKEYFDKNKVQEVKNFLENPIEWSKVNGGRDKI
tara:strand:- start:258 stop:944 length:687 start_codon:yes stop_codon:yes gene_type:complete